MKALQLEHPVDEHLKPIKDSDLVSTTMEVSTTKLRVQDLEVTGTSIGIDTDTNVTVDSSLTDGSTNPVENNAVFDGLALKLNLSGGTMTGSVNFGYYDITNVDSLDADKFSIASGTEMTAINDTDAFTENSATALATQQSIKAYVDNLIKYQYHTLFCGMNYNLTGGTQCIIPLSGATRPLTAFTSSTETTVFIAPYGGIVEKCYFRSEEGAGTTAIGFHKAENNTEYPSMTAECTVGSGIIADDTSREFDFSGVSDNDFSAGDVIGFTVDPTNDVNDSIFTAVLKYDITA